MKTIVLSDEQYESTVAFLNSYKDEYGEHDHELHDLIEHFESIDKKPKPEAKVRKRCDNCKYIGSNGYCKRYPPVRDAVSLLIHADWCGEFKQKQKEGV